MTTSTVENTEFRIVKILIIGDVKTGKTSIMKRYIYKTFDENCSKTLGVNFCCKRVRVENKLLKLQLWDFEGKENVIGISPEYYKNAVAAIIVFDITSKKTLDNAAKWKSHVDNEAFLRDGGNIPVVLFANKWDLVEETSSLKVVTDDEINDFCRENHLKGWFTTSGKTGLHVKKGVNWLVTHIMKIKKKYQILYGDDKLILENEQQNDTKKKTKEPENDIASNLLYLSQIEEKLNSVKNENNENLVSDNQNKSQLLDTKQIQSNKIINNKSFNETKKNEMVTSVNIEYGEDIGELDGNDIDMNVNYIVNTSEKRVKLMIKKNCQFVYNILLLYIV